MNCSEVRELLSAYYDGELPGDERSHVSDHLDECQDCATELAAFAKLSNMACALGAAVPPEHLWNQIEPQLGNDRSTTLVGDGSRSRKTSGFLASARTLANQSTVGASATTIALAATVLVAVGIGWFTFESWFGHSEHNHGEHNQFAIEFERYLDEFRHDPDAAQQILLAKYDNQLVGPNQAAERIGYRPAIAKGLPADYTLTSTRVVKMPCCTCVQSICQRNDGSTLAIFEHDDDSCHEKQCCLVDVDNQIAASWKRGTRHITLIGVRDGAEVSQMVAWLDEKEPPAPN